MPRSGKTTTPSYPRANRLAQINPSRSAEKKKLENTREGNNDQEAGAIPDQTSTSSPATKAAKGKVQQSSSLNISPKKTRKARINTFSSAKKNKLKNTLEGNNHPEAQTTARSATKAAKEPIQPRKASSPSASEATTARFDNHFKLLEIQLADMKKQMDDISSTMKGLRSAFNNQQGMPSTDETSSTDEMSSIPSIPSPDEILSTDEED